jgi:hypothetical protein
MTTKRVRGRVNRAMSAASSLLLDFSHDEKARLENEIAVICNQASMENLLRSTASLKRMNGPLVASRRSHYEYWLKTLEKTFHSYGVVPNERETAVIVGSILEMLRDLKQEHDGLLAKHASLIAMPGRQPNDEAELERYESMAKSEVQIMAARLRQHLIKPWHERPWGKVILYGITALIGALIGMLLPG